MTLPKVCKLSSESDQGEAENLSEFLTLEDLPSNILQSICQDLIRSRDLNSVLSVRSTCKNLYKLVNRFDLLLSLRFALDEWRNGRLQNFVDYATEKTNWMLERVDIAFKYKLFDGQKAAAESTLKYLQEKREFFGERLRFLTLQSCYEDTNIHYCNEIARILCNDQTTIDLGIFLSSIKGEKFSFCDRVTAFEMFIRTEINSSCMLWYFVNLEKLRVVFCENVPSNSEHIKLNHLTELRFDCMKSLGYLAPFTATEAFFPKVRYLRFDEYEPYRDQLSAFLSLHLPNLEHLEIYTDPELHMDLGERYLVHQKREAANGDQKLATFSFISSFFCSLPFKLEMSLLNERESE